MEADAPSRRRKYSPAATRAAARIKPRTTRAPGPKNPCSIEYRTSSRAPSAIATPPTQTVQRAPSASSQPGFDTAAGFAGGAGASAADGRSGAGSAGAADSGTGAPAGATAETVSGADLVSTAAG